MLLQIFVNELNDSYAWEFYSGIFQCQWKLIRVLL